MKITNHHNLPAALVNATSRWTRGPRDATTISVTELVDAPQIRTLTRAHWDDIE